MSQQPPNRPEQEFRAGGISAAVWAKTAERDGRETIQYSVRVQKRYYDDQSRGWKTTEYYFTNDLPKLQVVAQQAYEYIVLKNKNNGEDFPPAEE